MSHQLSSCNEQPSKDNKLHRRSFIMEGTTSGISLKIEILREALCDVKEVDPKLANQFYLFHWLKASKLDVRKAEKAIRASLKWRRENNIDVLLDQELDPEIASKFPMIFDLKTKAGAPLVYACVGGMDMAGLVKQYGKDRMVRHVAQINIKMEKSLFDWNNTWTGNVEDMPQEHMEGYFGIYDVTGYSVTKSLSIQAIQFCLEWAKMGINVFPCICRVARVINASKLVVWNYRIFRPIVTMSGLDVTIHGNNVNELNKHVYPMIEPHFLEELAARTIAENTNTESGLHVANEFI